MNDQKTKKDSKSNQIGSNSKIYILAGDPSFMCTTREGRGKIGDPSKRNKFHDGITLSSQHNDLPLLKGPLQLDAVFYFHIPQQPTHKKGDVRPGKFHRTFPALSHNIKYIEEVSKGILYQDNFFISIINARKVYDPNPRAEFAFMELK